MRYVKKWFAGHVKGYMVRPMIYMAFTRFLLALAASLLLVHFLGKATPLPLRSYAFVFFGVLYACMAWIAYLRLDGIKLPKLMMKRFNIRKKPARTYGDMADYTDQELVSFDELEDGEKDVCCLLSDLFCCVVFLALSVLWP